jgi:hypothetical protein
LERYWFVRGCDVHIIREQEHLETAVRTAYQAGLITIVLTSAPQTVRNAVGLPAEQPAINQPFTTLVESLSQTLGLPVH